MDYLLIRKLPQAKRPHRESSCRAGDLVRDRAVAKLVHLVARQIFEVVKLADVDALLDEKILVHRNE